MEYAAIHLVPEHLNELRRRKEELIDKTKAAVQDRLTKEINYWDHRAAQLREQEQAGKVNAKLNSALARQRADELTARLQKRLVELDQERKLSPLPPVVLGGALIIPVGLLRRLLPESSLTLRVGDPASLTLRVGIADGSTTPTRSVSEDPATPTRSVSEDSATPPDFALETKESERRAMEAVMSASAGSASVPATLATRIWATTSNPRYPTRACFASSKSKAGYAGPRRSRSPRTKS